MKIAAVVLVVLGMLAALCAAVLVKAVTLPKAAVVDRNPEVEVLVAARELPAMTLIDASMVRVEKVKSSDAPAARLGSAVQAVGKVLTTRALEGQPLLETAFAREGSAAHLAASLPAGKRAVSVSFNDSNGMTALLYPGGVVDVLVSLDSPSEENERISATLLQAVQVLAVGDRTVVATAKEDDGKAPRSQQSTSSRRIVTLLVDPQQAELLQLATSEGTLSLALRNPLDEEAVSKRVTRISELPMLRRQRSAAGQLPAGASEPLAAIGPVLPNLFEPEPVAGGAAPAPAGDAEASLWDVLVIRGGSAETQRFDVSGETAQDAPVEAGEAPVVTGLDVRAESPAHGS